MILSLVQKCCQYPTQQSGYLNNSIFYPMIYLIYTFLDFLTEAKYKFFMWLNWSQTSSNLLQKSEEKVLSCKYQI